MQGSLGEAFACHGCQSCVNTFHRYMHNYAYQCKHHPNVVDGMSLEELKTQLAAAHLRVIPKA